jgi:hypothetical protein
MIVNTAALVPRQNRVRRAREQAVQGRRVREPGHNLRGVGPVGQQKRHDAARRITEEGVLVGAFRKEGLGQRQRLGIEPELVGGRPERPASVERIENRVAAVGVEELRRVFQRRVVHNGGFAAGLDLQEELTNQRRFAGAGIAHHQDVARLEGVGDVDPVRGGTAAVDSWAGLPPPMRQL